MDEQSRQTPAPYAAGTGSVPVANLSRDASFIMVADVDKLAQNLGAYKNYLPAFIYDHVELFRSFILSVQITNVNNKLSHIFVFTYKE